MAEKTRKKSADDTKDSGLLSQLPVDRLREEALGFGRAFGKRGLSKLGNGVEGLTDRLTGFAEGAPKKVAEGGSVVKTGAKAAADKVTAPVGKAKDAAAQVKDTASQVKDTVDKVSGGLNKSEQSSGKKLKVTNIVETIDVPVSRDVAYEQWTQFEDFPSFMKKVENVTQEEDEVVTWQAQVFWSHRTWKATILDQVPNEHIVWKSQSEKGRVDGAVTFHELAPNLTRILVSLEYHPKGFFEHTGNLWRAQGRRVRLEMKHFRRHVANNTLLHRDELEGWTGEIHNKEVVDDGSGEGSENGQQKKSQSSSANSSNKSSQKSRTRTSSGSRSTKKSSASRSSGNGSSRSSSSGSGSSGSGSSRSSSSESGSSGNGSSRSSSSGNGSSGNSAPAKKTAARKTAAKKTAAKPAAKKAPAKKSAAKKSASSQTTSKQTTSKQRPTKKSSSSQSTSKQSTTKRSPRKQSASKRTSSRSASKES
ncbi:putative membrane protein [Nocardioides luteus]|uniref:Coenzyme Q-binding protein COQ10 START domain-containing protein n=1 Tax=Nocardioides luteus TaxID=1844 RepID=A0ABQ5T2P5_9ACTN|nr:SRPBCC family protein [Nocardioides luteus]MDR7311437.1 putative membrane protein [Nocardioides luteus]GGR55592.1 hypothetical protein GCM10010197_22830 [Nocardioides luteus]GLJ70088.1 hypothetical protein GCM10017579_41240 [Nocardioides luteus]